MDDFRSRFIASIQYGIDQLPHDTVGRPVVDAAAIAELAEAKCGTQISNDVPDELCSVLQHRLSNAVGFGSFSNGIVSDIIKVAFLTAAGIPELIESKAILFGLEYRQILNSLKPSMGKRTPMIQMFFEGTPNGGTINAYSTNGFSIMRHSCECYFQGRPFTGYVQIPEVFPGKLELVSILPNETETSVSYGGQVFKYDHPVIDMDLRQNWDIAMGIMSQTRVDTAFSPVFLREMAAGMKAGMLNVAPLRVSVSEGAGPIFAQCGPMEALVVPVKV